MTEEQIEQNAEEWAKKHEKILNYHHDEPETDFQDKKSAYIAGAHSRDEEIKELKLKLANKSGKVADIEVENALLKIKLNKLRNQQISVEDKKQEAD